MKVVDAMAEVLKREGVDVIFGYPRNPIWRPRRSATSDPSLSVRNARASTWPTH